MCSCLEYLFRTFQKCILFEAGKDTEGSAEKAKNDDIALEASSVDSGDNSSAQQSNGVAVPACPKVASNVEPVKDTVEGARTFGQDFVKSDQKGL